MSDIPIRRLHGRWTVYMDTRLLEERKKGHTFETIGAMVGKPKSAVAKRFRLLTSAQARVAGTTLAPTPKRAVATQKRAYKGSRPNITIVDLKVGECKYPTYMRGRIQYFCGHTATDGSWCDHHFKIIKGAPWVRRQHNKLT